MMRLITPWVADEEFLYYQGIYEIELSKISLPDGTPFFDEKRMKLW